MSKKNRIIIPKIFIQVVNNLSEHLFWDIDRNKIDLTKNKKLLIQRVLDYGLIDDWKIIKNYYGISEIGKTAVNIRTLDKKSMPFIALLSNIPEKKPLCYFMKQSIPKHCNWHEN